MTPVGKSALGRRTRSFTLALRTVFTTAASSASQAPRGYWLGSAHCQDPVTEPVGCVKSIPAANQAS
jgi:hypothetical protein